MPTSVLKSLRNKKTVLVSTYIFVNLHFDHSLEKYFVYDVSGKGFCC